MPSDTIVLSFDTSAAHCAAALLSDDWIWAERFETQSRGQAEVLFPLIEAMLSQEGVTWTDLGLIGVGIGPGNFTGTRISVSAARGLALGLGIPAVGVSVFEIMRGRMTVRDLRPALVSLAAPRDTVYLQEFAQGAAVSPAQQVALWRDPIRIEDPSLAEVTGYEAGEVAHFLNQSGHDGAPVKGFNAQLHEIGPTVARVAFDKWQSGKWDGARPSPIYVRPADAASSRDAPPVILP